MKINSNWEIVFKALSTYTTIELNGESYLMIKANDPILTVSEIYQSEHDILCRVMYKEHNGIKTEITLPCELQLNDMIKIADSITEEDRIKFIFLISMINKTTTSALQ